MTYRPRPERRPAGRTYGLRFIDFVGIAGPAVEIGAKPGVSWIKSYDPDAYDGRGDASWTDDPADALHFPTPQAALAFYRQTSKVRPRRADGRPNRPLTALTIMCEPIPRKVPT